MKNQYDVLVVGGGPAGAFAAVYAAKNGCSVLLVEKRPAIGTPVRCAEGIVKSDLEEFLKPDPKWISQEITKAKFISGDRSKFHISGKYEGEVLGYILERKIFDRDLVMKAASAGADVLVHARAEPLITNGKVSGAKIFQHGKNFEVSAKVVIASDGIESKFSKLAGVDTTVPIGEMSSCVQYLATNIDIDSKELSFYLSNDECPKGYIWVFPKGNRLANIGIGVSSLGTNGESVKNLLDRFLAKEFPNAKLIEVVAGGVSTCKPLSCTVADNLIITGDAARLIDPFHGGGLYQALYSGKLAGETAAKAVKENDTSMNSLMVYDKTWRSGKLGKDLAKAYMIKNAFFTADDETINRIIENMPDIHLKHVTIPTVILSAFKYNPWLIKKIPGILQRM